MGSNFASVTYCLAFHFSIHFLILTDCLLFTFCCCFAEVKKQHCLILNTVNWLCSCQSVIWRNGVRLLLSCLVSVCNLKSRWQSSAWEAKSFGLQELRTIVCRWMVDTRSCLVFSKALDLDRWKYIAASTHGCMNILIMSGRCKTTRKWFRNRNSISFDKMLCLLEPAIQSSIQTYMVAPRKHTNWF
jgi:hypothetical protein